MSVSSTVSKERDPKRAVWTLLFFRVLRTITGRSSTNWWRAANRDYRSASAQLADSWFCILFHALGEGFKCIFNKLKARMRITGGNLLETVPEPLQTVPGIARSALRGSNATSSSKQQIQVFVTVFWWSQETRDTFWGRSLPLEQHYTSVGFSDDFFIAIFELFRQNCVDTCGAWGPVNRLNRCIPPMKINVGFLSPD